ncbi:hypothetical protein [Streptomyces hirsutus]|uniref:hypothetical protein n=1 Tax=Streptomyces hirsutus TaxID=35620 RepID=UPI0036916004
MAHPLWSAPDPEQYERVHPPVLLVFHQVGKRSAKSQTQRVAYLTRRHDRQGRWHREGGFHPYDGRIPIVATILDLLREHGPAGPAFWRFGRDHREPLLDAIGSPRRDACLARRAEAHGEGEQCRAEREAAAREARRPAGADYGRKFTDDRWAAVGSQGWGQPRESHPYLCDDCQSRAVAAEQQAQADERERQEQERLRREQEAELAEQADQKAGGWLSRFRTCTRASPRQP